jgi:CDP-6-deoxy-D-xylo-4-hexulose-3-dehydrase
MKTEIKLREEIFKLVKEYYVEKFGKPIKFEPGITPITFAGRVFDHEELISLIDSSLDFWLTAGRFAQQFEKDFAKFMTQKYAILVNSGSSANLVALSTLTSPLLKERQLKPGDEVITVAAGFPTTVAPIIQNGLIPVFVDVEIETCNIKISELEKALSEKTKAIMIAHTLGNAFDLGKIVQFAKQHKLFIIEDCCDAVGTTYDGKMVGTFGDLATVSFYPAHHMTMGEGGAVLTNNPLLNRIATSYRDWGRDCYCEPGADNTCGRRFSQQFAELPYGYDHKYVYAHLGFNLKVTDMQAAIGVSQLKKLPSFIEKRRENFEKIKAVLKPFEEFLHLPVAAANSNPSWFGFAITVKANELFTKNQLTAHLEGAKILTRQLFAGNMIRQPAFKNVNYRVVGELKNTDYIMANTLFIGVYPGITDEMISYIKETFQSFFDNL